MNANQQKAPKHVLKKKFSDVHVGWDPSEDHNEIILPDHFRRAAG